MKLYQENLQQKLDESEQSRTELLESTKLMISVTDDFENVCCCMWKIYLFLILS